MSEEQLSMESEDWWGKPDHKEPKRIKASREQWKKLQAEKSGPCRVTGQSPFQGGVELHHLVPRSQQGDDVPENLVPLSREVHRKIEAHDYEARSRLRANLSQDEVNYVVREKGWAWLERYYPTGELLAERMDAEPGKPCPTCKRKIPSPFKGEKKKVRSVWSVKVPKDEAENGAEVLDSLMEQAAEKLGAEGKPAYYVLVPALYAFVSGVGD